MDRIKKLVVVPVELEQKLLEQLQKNTKEIDSKVAAKVEKIAKTKDFTWKYVE